MRKLALIVAGGALLVGVVAIAAIGLAGAELGHGFAKAVDFNQTMDRNRLDSEAFYQGVIHRLLADPDPEEFRRAWAPEARERLRADAFDALAAQIRTKLGKFVGCDGALQTLTMDFDDHEGLFGGSAKSKVVSEFSAPCLFDNGLAQMKAAVRKEGDGWLLTALSLSDQRPFARRPASSQGGAP